MRSISTFAPRGRAPASTVERIEIDWPAGHRTVHGPLPGDRRHEIREETP